MKTFDEWWKQKISGEFTARTHERMYAKSAWHACAAEHAGEIERLKNALRAISLMAAVSPDLCTTVTTTERVVEREGA